MEGSTILGTPSVHSSSSAAERTHLSCDYEPCTPVVVEAPKTECRQKRELYEYMKQQQPSCLVSPRSFLAPPPPSSGVLHHSSPTSSPLLNSPPHRSDQSPNNNRSQIKIKGSPDYFKHLLGWLFPTMKKIYNKLLKRAKIIHPICPTPVPTCH